MLDHHDDKQQQPKLLAGFAAQCVCDCEHLARFAPSGVQALASFVHHRATVVDVACKATATSSGCYSGEELARQSVALKFGDFVDFYCASHAGTEHWLKDVDDLEFYLCQCPIAVYRPDATCASAALPRIMDDFIVPETLPFRASDLSQVNLWIAVRASRTSLHYDAYANVLVVLHGRKTVTLYAPSESGNVYAHPVHSASANHSRVDVSDPSAAAAYPRFAQARAQQFVVNAGDALVIPEGWWHQVDTDAFTIAINYWFDGLQKQLAQVPATVTPYCARVLLQELLKRESARYLASRCAQVVGPKSTGTSQTTRPPRSTDECRESDVDHAVQSVVTALSQNDREQALFWIAGTGSDDTFRTVQQRLATEYPMSWCALLTNASDDLVALLTDCWEREVDVACKTNDVETTVAPDAASSEQQLAQFMETLFNAFPDSGEHIRTQFMAKKSAFASKICASVMLDTFGLSVQ